MSLMAFSCPPLVVLGVSLCVMMLQFFRLPNLRLSAILLCVLVIYDVFWVMYRTYHSEASFSKDLSENACMLTRRKTNLLRPIHFLHLKSIAAKIFLVSKHVC